MANMPHLLALPLRPFQPKRYRPGNLGTWSGHLPFANDLIWSTRPNILVELGTHHGESYFGFCQAVQESELQTRCFAVDTWRGDEHAGFYSDEVFHDVSSYNTRYSQFSTLIRSTFDEAVSRFVPESINVLHIDGLHTYSAVKQDFETWLPKVKPGGLVLLHDIHVRHADFEVWRFWEQLSEQFLSFQFPHCWGLGILRKPGGSAESNDWLDLLFHSDPETADRIRGQYANAAELLELQHRVPPLQTALAREESIHARLEWDCAYLRTQLRHERGERLRLQNLLQEAELRTEP